ncbi:hypothetical protein HII31_10759 [Pseudocercospora fuligena]|uniref:MYND-type domain-containing protein n=1 Tax=Pseudocercospora fuligena TaxID=685502 RepID=A0A8H6VH32_9PEZI|nr:hypothetical protein HII31_10759 [Pseudocercospora fuligena]
MDALPDFFNSTAFNPPPVQRRRRTIMKSVKPPSGPKGVAIIHDEDLEAVLEMSSPIYQSVRLRERGFKDSYFWKSLPLTSKLGVPLCFKLSTAGSPRPMRNTSLELLSLDYNPESEFFGEPQHILEEAVLVARGNGTDLLPKQMRAIVAFLDSELLPLVRYGINKDDPDKSDSSSAVIRSDQSVNQESVQDEPLQEQEEQENSGDVSNAAASDDHLDSSSTIAEPGEDIERSTKHQAEEALSQITPENFASFFASYRSEQAKEDPTWNLVECPTKTTSACGKCGIEDGAEGQALEVCGGCRRVLYCSKECQKADWTEHRTGCKKMVWKMTKRPSMKDAFE